MVVLSVAEESDLLKMSHFPPVPYFGTPYVSEGNISPNGGTHNAGASQHSYQVRAPSSYVQAHAQGQINGVAPSSQANSHSFYANTQRPAHGNGIHGTLTEFANQPSSHAFNPQQFSPASTLYDSSKFPQSFNSALPNTTNLSNQIYPRPKISNLQQNAHTQNRQSQKVVSAAHSVSDLEDGEVGDEEIDEAIKIPASTDMGLNFSRNSQHSGIGGPVATAETLSNQRASSIYEPSSRHNHGSRPYDYSMVLI